MTTSIFSVYIYSSDNGDEILVLNSSGWSHDRSLILVFRGHMHVCQS